MKEQNRSRRFSKYVLEAVLLLAVVFGVYQWQTKGLLKTDGTEQLDLVSFIQQDGTVLELSAADSRKKVLYFFAPWCAVCERSINSLDVLDEAEYQVIRVALDYPDSQSVEDFIERVGVNGRVVFGNQHHKQRFNISAYPTYYVLDSNMTVISRDIGFSTSLGVKLRTIL